MHEKPPSILSHTLTRHAHNKHTRTHTLCNSARYMHAHKVLSVLYKCDIICSAHNTIRRAHRTHTYTRTHSHTHAPAHPNRFNDICRILYKIIVFFLCAILSVISCQYAYKYRRHTPGTTSATTQGASVITHTRTFVIDRYRAVYCLASAFV